MFVMIYLWTVKAGAKKQFVQDWTAQTEHLKKDFGMSGSRLHFAENGLWVAYTEWKDKASYEKAGLTELEKTLRQRLMDSTESIEVIGPLSVIRDHLPAK